MKLISLMQSLNFHISSAPIPPPPSPSAYWKNIKHGRGGSFRKGNFKNEHGYFKTLNDVLKVNINIILYRSNDFCFF